MTQAINPAGDKRSFYGAQSAQLRRIEAFVQKPKKVMPDYVFYINRLNLRNYSAEVKEELVRSTLSP